MPSILSKILDSDSSGHSLHAWTPSCSEAGLELFFSVFGRCLKVYGPFAALQDIIERRSLKPWPALIESLRSSGFVSLLVYFASSFLCGTHQLSLSTSKTTVFAALMLSTMMVIPLERQSRINTVTVLFLKASTEAIYKALFQSNAVENTDTSKNPAIILYAASLAISLALVKRDGYKNDPLSRILRTIMGTGESAQISYNSRRASTKSNESSDIEILTSEDEDITPQLPNCRHASWCSVYASLGFGRAFACGYLWLVTLNGTKHPFRLLKHTTDVLFDRKALKFGLFLGVMSSSYKLMMCTIRRHYQIDTPISALAAGTLAGVFSGRIFPSNQLALYMFWKTAFSVYWSHLKDEKDSKTYATLIINGLFCFSSATVLMFYFTNPNLLPRAYVRACDQIVPRKYFGDSSHLTMSTLSVD